MKKKSEFYDNVPPVKTIKELVTYGVGKGQDEKILIYHKNEIEHTKTFNDVWHDINGLGAYLFSIGLKDCHIALIDKNSYEWIVSYFAVLLGRDVFVPLDPKLSGEDLAQQLIESDCKGIFYSEHFKEQVDIIRNTPGMPITNYLELEKFDEYVAEGQKILEGGNREYPDVEVKPEDLACIVFTSGTTGKSKGVMLSHKNLAADATASCKVVQGHCTVGFLPLNHTYSWVSTIFAAFICIGYGYICGDVKNLVKDFQKYHPQNFAGVPLVIETIYKNIWRTAKRQGTDEKLRKGIKLSRFLLKFGIDIRRKLFKQIHDHLGGNLEMIICGGASLDPEYEQGLYDIGIQTLNGYGITECSPAVTTNRQNNYKIGSVGLPMPCNEIKINDPDADGVGEIYVKGDNVMMGYYNDPDATAEAFDGEWFKTGDFGRIDKDGFLFFVGRKKNLIILSNGKNVSPEELETKLMQKYHYIKEVMVYEEKSHIAAEFFLNTEEYPEAKEWINRDVHEFNKTNPKWKYIRYVKIRDEEFPKTTTLKIKRNYGATSNK